MKQSVIIPALVQQLEESYRTRSWHGTNLRGSIRGLTMEQRCWRPSPKRHNIWEVLVHCAYWKYVVRRRITGEKHGSFPLKGSNFFPRPMERTDAAWKNDILLLDEMHEALLLTIRNLSLDRLDEHPNGSQFTKLQTITGIAAHDVYHAGQIQLLKRLQKK